MKPMLVSSILLLIIPSGMMVHVYTLEHDRFRGDVLLSDHIEACDFIRLHTPKNASVLTVTSLSGFKLIGISGLPNHRVITAYSVATESFPYFAAQNPENVFHMLAKSQVRYIFLSSEDLQKIQSDIGYRNGFIYNHLLKYLPIAFENSKVTIYELPEISPPLNSGIALVYTSQSRTISNCDSTENWNLKCGGGQDFLVKKTDKYVERYSCINWSINLEGGDSIGDHYLLFDPPGLWDFSEEDLLCFWLSGDNSSRNFWVYLRDSSEAFIRWTFRIDWYGWKKISLPLEK